MNSYILGFIHGAKYTEQNRSDLNNRDMRLLQSIGIPVEYGDRFQMVDDEARTLGWKFMIYDSNTYMVSYKKDNTRINVYLSKMTVVVSGQKNGIKTYRNVLDRSKLIKLFTVSNKPKVEIVGQRIDGFEPYIN